LFFQNIKIIKTILPSAPIKAVSSQRSEEIEPKAGIAIPNTRGQFAPKEKKIGKLFYV
jgi:hypothetical protein